MGENKKTSVYISPSWLRECFTCYENLQIYAPSEKNPLLDIINDQEGNQVRIFLTNDHHGGITDNEK